MDVLRREIGLNQNSSWMKTRLLHIVNCRKKAKPVCCLFVCLLCAIGAVGCGVSDAVEQKQPDIVIEKTLAEEGAAEEVFAEKAPTLADNIPQKPITTFSWEHDGGVWTKLQINGDSYRISGSGKSPEEFQFQPQELLCYWEALKALPAQDIPENLNNLFNYELTLQDELDADSWRAQQKPIETLSWEKKSGAERTTLWINGEEYSYQVLDNGTLLISDDVMHDYGAAIAEVSEAQMPEDLYRWLHDSDYRRDVSINLLGNLTGGIELAPGERIECSDSVYFDGLKRATFQAACQHGNAAKLKVYRGYEEGDRDTSLEYFTAAQDEQDGQLTATIPQGKWYFTIENGGSHTVMVDSVTLNF